MKKASKASLIVASMLLCQAFPAPVHAQGSYHQQAIRGVVIEGNKRVEEDTILSYIAIQPGKAVTEEDLNAALKTLFNTGFFADVKVSVQQGQLIIRVIENPIINRISYEGNSKLKDEQIREEIQLRPREVLSRGKIQSAQQRILEMYRAMGRFMARVEPKIIPLDDNRADVAFEIFEGDVAHIESIKFIGNKHFSSAKLQDTALLSKRYKWFRFFANDDTFDPHRFQADQKALRQYYYDRGYPDFRQLYAVSEITPSYNAYHLTFALDEGKRYDFGNVRVTSRISAVNAGDFADCVSFKKGEIFSDHDIQRTIEKLSDALGSKGFAFTEIEAKLTKHSDNQTVDVEFEIQEGPRLYVERVEIQGNSRTRDHVIRREIMLHEGDALNSSRMKRSERNLKDLGYFKSVSVVMEPGSAPDRVIIVTKVEEQPTGDLSFSAGFATVDGPVGTIRFTERNFMGKGQAISAAVSAAGRHQDVNFSFTEPYLFGRKLEGSMGVFAERSTRMRAYTRTSKGLAPSLAYNLTDRLSQVLSYVLKEDKVSKVSQQASNYLKDQVGSYVTSEIGQTLYYDRRDSRLNATSGYVLSLGNSFAGLGGKVKYLKHVAGANFYYSPVEDVVMALKGSYGVMQKAGKKIRVVDSFFLGADSFRGFQYGGLGPHDKRTGDPLGGTQYWTGTLETLFPIGLPNELGVKGALFTDFGTVWDSPEKGPYVRDNKYIRASWGVGLAWNSPFGPIRIDYATPVRKDKFDDTQRFLLGFRTQL